jgi:hypothetical protein
MSSISDREVISAIISCKYDEEPEKKKRLINLFFSGAISNQECNEVKETISEVSSKFRGKIKCEGFNLGNQESRMKYLASLNREQLKEYTIFNEKIRKVFDFKIGPETSNLKFRMGPQSSYLYIELDHYIINEDIKKRVTYNNNKKFNPKTKTTKFTPTVYINTKHRLFKNVLNFMKEMDWLDDFVFGFEEKVLMVI